MDVNVDVDVDVDFDADTIYLPVVCVILLRFPPGTDPTNPILTSRGICELHHARSRWFARKQFVVYEVI